MSIILCLGPITIIITTNASRAYSILLIADDIVSTKLSEIFDMVIRIRSINAIGAVLKLKLKLKRTRETSRGGGGSI